MSRKNRPEEQRTVARGTEKKSQRSSERENAEAWYGDHGAEKNLKRDD